MRTTTSTYAVKLFYRVAFSYLTKAVITDWA